MVTLEVRGLGFRPAGAALSKKFRNDKESD